MDKKKMLLYVQAALCVLWAVLMAAAAVHIYSDGIAYRAQGHPEAWIYTREKAAAAIRFISRMKSLTSLSFPVSRVHMLPP